MTRAHDRPIVFLDRDGVLIDPVARAAGSPPEAALRPEDVRLAPNAASGLHALRQLDVILVLVSNQPAAAKGEASLGALAAVHRRFVELLEADGLELDAIEYCLHHPDATWDALRGPCQCRKPQPGLLTRAAIALGVDLANTPTWLIGDTDADVGAGLAAGAKTILIEHPLSAHRRLGVFQPHHTAENLDEASWIIRSTMTTTLRPHERP